MFMLMGLNQIFHVLFRKKKKVKPSLNIKITLFPMKALFSPFFLSLPFFILFFFFHLFFHFKSQERKWKKVQHPDEEYKTKGLLCQRKHFDHLQSSLRIFQFLVLSSPYPFSFIVHLPLYFLFILLYHYFLFTT